MGQKKIKHLTKEQVDFLFANYPNTPNEVLAEQLGVTKWAISRRADKHKLHKSPEYVHQLRSRQAKERNSADQLNTPEAKRKREQSLKHRYNVDAIRIRWGLEPISKKRHYRTEPKARLTQRNRLERLGYIVDKENLIAYYTPDTVRATQLEKLKRGERNGRMIAYYDFQPIENKDNKD